MRNRVPYARPSRDDGANRKGVQWSLAIVIPVRKQGCLLPLSSLIIGKTTPSPREFVFSNQDSGMGNPITAPRWQRWLWPVLFGVVLVGIVPRPCLNAAGPRSAIIEFNRDIRPILSDTCFQCHGPDQAKRKAKLRLDSETEVFAHRGG